MKVLLKSLIFVSASFFAQEHQYDYTLFTNSLMKDNFFYGNVKFSGNSSIKNQNSKLLVDKNEFHSPGNSLLLDYKNAKKGKWEALIEYEEVRGKDFFNKANFLSFWIKSKKSESNVLPTIKLQKTDGTFSKSINIKLTKKNQWENILIDISSLDVSVKDDPKLIKAIVFSQPEKSDADNKIWLDDIAFIDSKEKKTISETPNISSAKGYMNMLT
ncbi:hypothetical protein [Epilithonimonas sp. UC225_85]|uniref:hypothetical protein n=1 Tax=Epilithonimonas sp. UC225_85 TaxID=3350167 RepID=UPI0036D40429